MKQNVVTDYVRNAFKVSSNCFWDKTDKRLMHILRNNNYPIRVVLEILRKVQNEIGIAVVSSEIGILTRMPENIQRSCCK